MVGGGEADFERALPLFEALGKTIVHVGEPGAGPDREGLQPGRRRVTFAAVSEALVLGSKAGVDRSRSSTCSAAGSPPAACWSCAGGAGARLHPGFRIDLHHKDLGIALESGDATASRCPSPVWSSRAPGARAQGPRGRRPLRAARARRGVRRPPHRLDEPRRDAPEEALRRMNPMEAVVRVLEDEGVRVAFGIPGAAILPLYDAMERSSIDHLTVRHEEARRTSPTGGPAPPGGRASHRHVRARRTNMITGLYTALADSIPIICITGQANRACCTRSPSRRSTSSRSPGRSPSGRTRSRRPRSCRGCSARRSASPRGPAGPVLMDLPLDVQKGAGDRVRPGADRRAADRRARPRTRGDRAPRSTCCWPLSAR